MKVGDTHSYVIKTEYEIGLVTINIQKLYQTTYKTIFEVADYSCFITHKLNIQSSSKYIRFATTQNIENKKKKC